ncbi:MAG: aminotransferase class I/II-fold pyridoxal phosphate-dependent enzyme [Gemmatimonadota bacterium]|nr:MAG: aminotransferase class I/II-fold pyridoxal phosphate-dependent enzyme [Gemmatimonadota bacterium]
MLIDPSDVAICVAGDEEIEAQGAAPTSTPIVQTSLFTFPNFQALVDGLGAEHRSHVYTRGRNPTVEAVERKLAALERGEACKCFGSGMAAISAVMLGLLRSGDHILFVNHTYGPTLQLAEHLSRFGIEHDLLLDLDVHAFEQALRPNTQLVWLESPGTMLFRVLDIPALTSVARERGIPTCVDNSWATPLCQKPLSLGADIVVHSCTKYLAGHSDLVAGAVISTSERIEEIFFRAFLLNGGILAPFDAWLLLRGLRTLPIRLRQHEADALRVARFLQGHPAVRRVFHPALTEDSQLVERQFSGYSGLLSFELVRGDFESVARFIDGLRRFRIGVSWGGVESLVISPNRGTNRLELEARGIPPGMVRLSIGLEGSDVLIDDLAGALDLLG